MVNPARSAVNAALSGKAPDNLVSEPFGSAEADREMSSSSSSHGVRRGSTEDRQGLIREDPILSLEGTILNLNNKLDQALEELVRPRRRIDLPQYAPAIAPPPPSLPPAPNYGHHPPVPCGYHQSHYGIFSTSPSPYSVHPPMDSHQHQQYLTTPHHLQQWGPMMLPRYQYSAQSLSSIGYQSMLMSATFPVLSQQSYVDPSTPPPMNHQQYVAPSSSWYHLPSQISPSMYLQQQYQHVPNVFDEMAMRKKEALLVLEQGYETAVQDSTNLKQQADHQAESWYNNHCRSGFSDLHYLAESPLVPYGYSPSYQHHLSSSGLVAAYEQRFPSPFLSSQMRSEPSSSQACTPQGDMGSPQEIHNPLLPRTSGSFQMENSRSPAENVPNKPDHRKSSQPEYEKVPTDTLNTKEGQGNMESSPSLTNVNLGTELPSLNLKIVEDMALEASLKSFQNAKGEVSTIHVDNITHPDGDHIVDVLPSMQEPVIDTPYDAGIEESQVSILDLTAVLEENVSDFNFEKHTNMTEPTVIFLTLLDLTPWLHKYDYLQFMANMEGVSSTWYDHGIFLVKGSNLDYKLLYKQTRHHKTALEKLVILIWDPGSNNRVFRAESYYSWASKVTVASRDREQAAADPWSRKGKVALEGVSLHRQTTSAMPDYRKMRNDILQSDRDNSMHAAHHVYDSYAANSLSNTSRLDEILFYEDSENFISSFLLSEMQEDVFEMVPTSEPLQLGSSFEDRDYIRVNESVGDELAYDIGGPRANYLLKNQKFSGPTVSTPMKGQCLPTEEKVDESAVPYNKLVINSRDTQEGKLEQGLHMLKVFKEHVSMNLTMGHQEPVLGRLVRTIWDPGKIGTNRALCFQEFGVKLSTDNEAEETSEY